MAAGLPTKHNHHILVEADLVTKYVSITILHVVHHITLNGNIIDIQMLLYK